MPRQAGAAARVNGKVPKVDVQRTCSYLHGDHLYVLLLAEKCLQILVVPLLAQEDERLLCIEARPLCAHLERVAEDVQLAVLCPERYMVFAVGEELVATKEVLCNFHKPEMMKRGETTIVKSGSRFYKLCGNAFVQLGISPYFSSVRSWGLVGAEAEFVGYSTRRHVQIYTLESVLVRKAGLQGTFLPTSSGDIMCVDKSLVAVLKVRDGELANTCQIDINMDVDAEWMHGDYIPDANVVFLSGVLKGQPVVYVDGYLFHTQHLVTSIHLYRNCCFCTSKSALYFLPNDPDFDLQFTKTEMDHIREMRGNYVGRKYLLRGMNGTQMIGHVLACIVNCGMRVGIRKMIINEIGRPSVHSEGLVLLLDLLRFDYRVYEIWMAKEVDVDMIYDQISSMVDEEDMNLEMLMMMERLSFTEVQSNLGKYEPEYMYLKGKHELRRGGDYIQSFARSGLPAGKQLLERGSVSDIVYMFKKDMLGDLEQEDYANIVKLCLEKDKKSICAVPGLALEEDDVIGLLVSAYNKVHGDVGRLVEYCTGNYTLLAGLGREYHRDLERAVLKECKANERWMEGGHAILERLGNGLPRCILRYMMFDKTGDKRFLSNFAELLGDRVFVYKRRFIGKELFEDRAAGEAVSYDKVIRENIVKLRNLRSGCVWTDVLEASKWPGEFQEYKKELQKAEEFYFRGR
ncbi:UNVERIFIED_CONTAM: hypothetical protein PYX00_011307 [Menopon gallinae]|uniref:Uncharacterized protein n=1 Tax=Menopon gallinae TaxID=328185 RepID=A0AAW2H758_9NEOP